MKGLGDWQHKITFGTDGVPVSDGKGGTRPAAPVELATVWCSAKKVDGKRALKFEKLGITNAYQFECWYLDGVASANRIKYRGEWLTLDELSRMGEREYYYLVVAYGGRNG